MSIALHCGRTQGYLLGNSILNKKPFLRLWAMASHYHIWAHNYANGLSSVCFNNHIISLALKGLIGWTAFLRRSKVDLHLQKSTSQSHIYFLIFFVYKLMFNLIIFNIMNYDYYTNLSWFLILLQILWMY